MWEAGSKIVSTGINLDPMNSATSGRGTSSRFVWAGNREAMSRGSLYYIILCYLIAEAFYGRTVASVRVRAHEP